MLAYFLIVLASAFSAAVVEMVIETAYAHGRTILAFGNTLWTPPDIGFTIAICSGLSAAASLAMVAAIAYGRGRRLERRMAEELDERWEEVSRRSAGTESRTRLLEWRIAELQNHHDELLARRDGLIQEMAAAREHTAELVRIAHEHKAALERPSGTGGADGLVVVPDVGDPNLDELAADPAGLSD